MPLKSNINQNRSAQLYFFDQNKDRYCDFCDKSYHSWEYWNTDYFALLKSRQGSRSWCAAARTAGPLSGPRSYEWVNAELCFSGPMLWNSVSSVVKAGQSLMPSQHQSHNDTNNTSGKTKTKWNASS